jgi:hypothetical protein
VDDSFFLFYKRSHDGSPLFGVSFGLPYMMEGLDCVEQQDTLFCPMLEALMFQLANSTIVHGSADNSLERWRRLIFASLD